MSDKGIIFSAPMVRALLAGRKTQTRRLLNPQPPTVEAVRSLSGSGYHWFARKPDDRKWSVAGPVWAVRQLTGEHLPKISVPYAVGDRLYVRESWNTFVLSQDLEESWPTKEIPACHPDEEDNGRVQVVLDYMTGGLPGTDEGKGPWRPSIHMPRWASRITLATTDVRVQRLQDISEADAIAEGIYFDEIGYTAGELNLGGCRQEWSANPLIAYANLWRKLHTKPGATWDDNPWVVAVSFDVARHNIDRPAHG